MAFEGSDTTNNIAIASTALLNLYKQNLHYANLPDEVEQFRHVVDTLQQSINVSKRLRWEKSRDLDDDTKEEVDITIARSVDVLGRIFHTIEACRTDLENQSTISVKKRLNCLVRGQGAFISTGITLNSCVQCLGMQIGRMDAINPPIYELPANFAPQPPASFYRDSLAPQTQGLRAPSRRKLLPIHSRNKSTSNTLIGSRSISDFSTEKEVVVAEDRPHHHQHTRNTISVSSFDHRPSASYSAFSRSSHDVSAESVPRSCRGDTCNIELCSNHGGSGPADEDEEFSQIDETLDQDHRLIQQGSAPFSSQSPTDPNSWKFLVVPSIPRRKKNKSGLI